MIRSQSLLSLVVLAILSVCCAASADPIVLVAWDEFADFADPTLNADDALTGFEGTISGIGEMSDIYGSNDGTYGNLVTGASAAVGAPTVTVGESGATLTLTNNTDNAYDIEWLHLDWGPRNNGPTTITVTYTSGGLGDADTLIGVGGPDSGINSRNYNYNDYDFDLFAVLGDIRLDHGENAVFTLDFTGGGGGSNTSGLDNIAIRGSLVPEPAAVALLAGGMGLMLTRRRRQA